MAYDVPAGVTPLDTHAADGLVGKPLNRVDGPLKVTGRATYSAEYAGQDKVAYGFVVQSTIAKGRVSTIDTAAAERMPGVVAVLTYKNASPPEGQGERVAAGPGTGKRSFPQLKDDRVEHAGQPVALAVAETFEQARAAAYAVVVSYVAETPTLDMSAQLADGFTPKEQEPDSRIGDFASAFAQAPVKLDVTYTTPLESHAMMEPHATIATWTGDGLTLYTSNQLPVAGRSVVANTLKMPKTEVRIVSRYVGGGFGGKLDVWPDAILAALASRRLRGRPVKVVLTRQQVFGATGHRPQTQQHIRLGTDAAGRIQAVAHDVWTANNSQESFFEGSAKATRTLYAGANRQTTHKLIHLDIPIGNSMRAPGEATGQLAMECAMDELAETLGLDPIELRVRNEPTEDPEKHLPYSSRNLVELMKVGAERFGWDKRNPKPGQVRDGHWMVGIGMAAATRSVAFQNASARVTLKGDGSLVVQTAMTDLGTGTYTILTQVAAEMTGLPMDKVLVQIGDTNFPDAPGSGGSWGAQSAGSAVYAACEALRDKLAASVNVETAVARFENGHLLAHDTSWALADLAAGGPVMADGSIAPGKLFHTYSQQSYGAQFAEVAVDVDTGEVRMRRMLGVFSAGRILNEKTAKSQLLGGMTMGLSAALFEDAVLDMRHGNFVNHDLAEYHVAAHADVPEVDVIIVPQLDAMSSPIKAKGVGELGICGAGAAVANAVYNATGVRVRDYPITLDKILKDLPGTA